MAWIALPPSAPAGVKLPRLKPAGKLPTTLSALTMLSTSLALTLRLADVPAASVAAVQTGTIGWALATLQAFSAEALLRGNGAAAAKSAALLSVSAQPRPARCTDVVFTVAGAAAVSKPLAVVPQPTRSTSAAPTGFAPVSALVFDTSATLPPVPAMPTVPVASGVGRLAVPPAPWACCTR